MCTHLCSSRQRDMWQFFFEITKTLMVTLILFLLWLYELTSWTYYTWCRDPTTASSLESQNIITIKPKLLGKLHISNFTTTSCTLAGILVKHTHTIFIHFALDVLLQQEKRTDDILRKETELEISVMALLYDGITRINKESVLLWKNRSILYDKHDGVKLYELQEKVCLQRNDPTLR